ncbi:MAG: hypothetical protein KDD47_14655, partial [Acidobacteria bacterium]|nr:hypothetical protein [Acidobacteriota bacterium]
LGALAAMPALGVSRDPNGVNVNSQGATTVFITFGGLVEQVPVENVWCGALMPAAPDIGFRCDPATVFGRLPLRFDQSRLSAGGSVFTDIMSIPPSVARRAYQAAERGETSSFFYVRRFESTVGGPDEYVFVTCRLAGGGARVPLALLDVRLAFEVDETVASVARGGELSRFSAEISYNGTGRLRGRWEVVLPGDSPPETRDLLTEATLPPAERPLQRRFTLVDRFNVFLPPTGHVVLPGPDPSRLPTEGDGLYQILLRVEASDDKEGDSNLNRAEAGEGIVHTGAVAGFPLPTLRYFVGTEGGLRAALAQGALALLAPAADSAATAGKPLDFSWSVARNVGLYRVEFSPLQGDAKVVFSALLQQGIGSYRAPAFVWDHVGGDGLKWRVVALGLDGEVIAETEWRPLRRGA